MRNVFFILTTITLLSYSNISAAALLSDERLKIFEEISKNEINAPLETIIKNKLNGEFTAIDENKDGLLSSDEYKKYKKGFPMIGMRDAVMRLSSTYPKGAGKVIERFSQRQQSDLPPLLFRKHDENKDSMIDFEEYWASTSEYWYEIDKSNDNLISPEEASEVLALYYKSFTQQKQTISSIEETLLLAEEIEKSRLKRQSQKEADYLLSLNDKPEKALEEFKQQSSEQKQPASAGRIAEIKSFFPDAPEGWKTLKYPNGEDFKVKLDEYRIGTFSVYRKYLKDEEVIQLRIRADDPLLGFHISSGLNDIGKNFMEDVLQNSKPAPNEYIGISDSNHLSARLETGDVELLKFGETFEIYAHGNPEPSLLQTKGRCRD